MIQPVRLARYSTRKEIETFFKADSDSPSLFEPHYNMAPAHPVLVVSRSNDEIKYEKVRWGLAPEQQENQQHTVSTEEAKAHLSGSGAVPIVLPISGFYLWKRRGKRADQPFFIRLLRESLLPVAGIALREKSSGKMRGCAMIRTASSHLIAPLAEEMPLMLNQTLAHDWIDGECTVDELIQDAEGLYSIVDMSVLRVSKKVNDLEQNSPKLIQPLPK
jgi:putative SOS response-associated peptidase YedK